MAVSNSAERHSDVRFTPERLAGPANLHDVRACVSAEAAQVMKCQVAFFARWPKGPAGKRVTSIWNWGFPINVALTDKQKRATWLFIEWATSAETQARTSWKFAGPAKRSGINRMSLWRSPEFAAAMQSAGDNFIPAALESLEQDTDVDWRPRVPQWPAIGETMATAIQSALVGQKKPKEALDEAQARIQQILKG